MRGRQTPPAPSPPPVALTGTGVRRQRLVDSLARTAAEVEALRALTDGLDRRDRQECQSLLQSLELRCQELTLRLERLAADDALPERQWARLEESVFETEEHLGFLAQTIRGRAH